MHAVPHEPRVVVVGGGIIGLTSAFALLESGYTNVHIVAESYDAIVSHVAGAIWMPFALPANVSSHKPREWCEASMAWLTKLWREHGEQATGIHFVKGVDVSGHGAPDIVHPYWAHCVKDYRLLTAAQAAAISADATHGVAFETIVYNPTTLMHWLRTQITALGGTLETRRIASLDDLNCDVVVNCTGLSARELVKDTSAFPIRGQTVKIYNPSITEFRMVVHANGEHTYILPRPNGEIVLGGTVEPHNPNTFSNTEDVDAIVERCARICPAVRTSRVVGSAAGLRPGRTTGVRVELDPRRSAQGAFVLHNYGHGGSGHTLQYGCAMDIVRLAMRHCPPQSTAASGAVSRL